MTQSALSELQVHCPSQSSLISSEESAFLLFSPPQSVGPPAKSCHQQHDYANTEQCHGHHFGLEQRVKGECHPGTRHAND